ncbi:aa3-type cytochrome oxidase subunit III [Brachybacterium huguangmaarense]
MSDVTTATLPPRATDAPTIGRPNATQIGTIVWLASELMFFAGLFAMYFTLHSMVPDVFAEGQEHFKLLFALTNTAILVASSVTCQFGVFAAEAGRKSRTGSIFNLARWGLTEWYVLTFIMGAIFVSGQALEYTELAHAGVSFSSSPFGSIFFLATGFHGLHVIGGLIAFLFVLARSYTAKNFGHHEAVSAICVSYYWHFVDVVWVGLFFVVYLMGPWLYGFQAHWSFF